MRPVAGSQWLQRSDFVWNKMIMFRREAIDSRSKTCGGKRCLSGEENRPLDLFFN